MKTNKLINHLVRVNFFLFVLYILAIDIVFTYLFGLITPQEKLSNPLNQIDNSKIAVFFAAVIQAPIIETLLFQAGPIMLSLYFIKMVKVYRYIIALLLSSSLMAIAHIFNIYYFIYMFIVGLLLASAFIISTFRRQNAYLTICFVHSIWNLIIFISSQYNI